MTTPEEARFWRDKHVLEQVGKTGAKGIDADGKPYNNLPVLGISEENYEKINAEKEQQKAQEKLEEKPLIKTPSIIPDFKFLTEKEVLNYQAPEYEWIVQDLIQPKKVIIVAGKSSTFKSWFNLALGYAIATGKPFVSNFETEQSSVLYLDRENDYGELKKRLGLLRRGLGVEEKDLPMYFLSEETIKLDNQNHLVCLEKYIKEKNISVIFVDTYRRAINFEENDANEVSRFFIDYIKPLCERTNVSFVFIHHEKKGKPDGDEKDMLRGSSDLVNYVDGVIQIARQGRSIIIKQTKNRGAREREPFKLHIDTDEETFFKLTFECDVAGGKVDRCAEALLVWITSKGLAEFSTQDAKTIVEGKGFKKSNFYNSIVFLQEQGYIEKRKKGMYEVLQQRKLAV